MGGLYQINTQYGFGVGDRVLERLGITAQRFFRAHDWVGRYEDDAIAALLPQTTLDDAIGLAERLRTTVEQRLAFKTDRTDTPVKITVSVGTVGTTPIKPDIDPRFIIEQAEEALRGAHLKGYNRVERVALVLTSVSLLGAANLLKSPLSVIRRLVRTGQLVASRQGRYLHVDRASVQRYHIDQLARMREQLD